MQPAGTLRIGRFRGIAIYVRASWLLVAVLIAVVMAPRVEEVHPGLGAGKYVAGVVFAMLLYGSVLLHELSHALMALRVGLKVRSISLQFLGGATEIEGESSTAAQEFKVAVVGPLTSLAVGFAALALLAVVPDGLPRLAVEGLCGANLVVGVLNLVPGLPLDGGRVLRAAVWQARGNMHTGTIAAAWGGRLAAVLALASPLIIPAVFGRRADPSDYLFGCVMAGFLWSGATASLINARLRQRLPALRARPLARRVVAVAEDLAVAEAVRRAQEAGAGGIIVHDAHNSLVGIVHEAALLSIPEERRPWVPVSSVARTLTAGLVLPADSAGEDLIRAMARTPANEYVLVEPDGSLYGLLVTADVDAAFEAGAQGWEGLEYRTSEEMEQMTDEANRDSWSGVSRGPLKPGEWVRLVDGKGRRHNICLESGKSFHTNRGGIEHDELIGRDEGFTVTSTSGGEYLVFRPMLNEFVVSMPRGAAVVYPKDAAQIVAMADIFPGARVVEAGVGSGALTCSLLRAVGPTGRVSSYERREEFADVARKNVTQFFGGDHPAWELTVGDLVESIRGVDAAGTVDRVVLDMLAPWECVDAVAEALVPGGVVVAYVATTTQLGKVVETLRAHGEFTEPQPWETLVREWHVEGLAVRPSHKMNGHTGFLVTARRMAPGNPAPRKKRRPAPGAYGEDYSGPRPSDLAEDLGD